jgi:hypothetical protein
MALGGKMSYTFWINEENGCEICLGFRGRHEEGTVPDRHHPHCRCTKVTYVGSGSPICQRDAHTVIAVTEGSWDYSPSTGLAEEITVEFDAEVLCRNNAQVNFSFALHYAGSELDELQRISDSDYASAIGNLLADAEDKALELAGTHCPGCQAPARSVS